MHGTNENLRVEDSARSSYDIRIAALETDVAVIRNSFATKDDISALRDEMRVSHERLFALIYEFKLEVQTNSAKQREEFQAALVKQREEFYTALAKQREDFHTALSETKIDLHRAMMGHLWKLYGFASLMLGGVYFIARYVH